MIFTRRQLTSLEILRVSMISTRSPMPASLFSSWALNFLVRFKIFPDKPVTEKPAGTRMGSGKGSPEDWVAVVKPGRVLFELADVNEETAREALRLASHKLPIRCKFVKREELDTVKEGDAE